MPSFHFPELLVRRCFFPALIVLLTLPACDQKAAPTSAPPTTPAQWRTFEGSWSASGTRTAIALGEHRRASNIDLSGTLLLSGPDRPGVGFRAQAIALVDSQTGLVGRGLWTDENGDQVFSELAGEGTRDGNRITGTFLGGTGRYAGVSGDYEFSWQFVIELEDGTIQGRATGFRGRFRIEPAAAESAAGGEPR